MQDLKDEEVMLEYQKGESSAMDELLRRYKVPVYHFVLRLVANLSEAEDLAQEVFLRLYQSKDTYAPSGKFSTWIFSIAHNLAVSRLRKKKWLVFWPRKTEDPEQLQEFESFDPSPETVAVKNEMSDVVKRCVQNLPFLQREALILREYQNLEYQEIAKILKKSQGTIKTLIHRARMNLKLRLLPYLGDESKGGNYV